MRALDRVRRLLPLALVTLFSGACDFYYYRLPSPDELWHVIPWFDHMVHARYIRPYETAHVPRYTPEGSVPVSGSEPDWSAEWVAGKTTTANALKNPLTNSRPPGPSVPLIRRDMEAAGDTLYQNFCSVCHGPTGNADGTVSRQMGAPSLLTPRARGYTDGYIYSIIRYGRGVMPRYGDKVVIPSERWAIVSHVRKLQAQSAAPPGDATPVPPGPSATGSTSSVPR
ncbi:MAG TPA: cytochrome c [Gemmatimonadales bacterium]|nr:cytochrome c [Gemmatimonadales bacterium]